ncbi:hypothetical protein Z968_12510 [Clostridium novyi A str. 4552]|uniref:Mannosyl-glycoprotein endo-beta-N-acetylglucosamidase-like domain-containing protein n=2 Tax=Clostridium novyi TaxID=1542 RepID=A0A0A0HY36_CLONO|nr:hypothetical protein Z968_12510 [Clostridium novyi A str. 4552]
MNNRAYCIKRISVIVLISALFIFKPNYCYADNQKILEVNSNKKWEIKFNKPIAVYTVYDGIQIKDDKNNVCELVFYFKDNGTRIVVENLDKFYQENRIYTLTVNNNVKDKSGKSLSKSKNIKFKINDKEEYNSSLNTKYPYEDTSDINIKDYPNLSNKVSIMGSSDLIVKNMGDYVLRQNKNPKISVDIYSLAKIFLEEGQAEGVRGDIAFCQSIKETGFFKYGGQVLPEQNNYAGIGALNNEPIGKGAWFKSPREGVRAQIQHLKGYATIKNLNRECVDPRYNILRNIGVSGTVPFWQDLNGKWAVPGKGYGEDIIYIYNKIKHLR